MCLMIPALPPFIGKRCAFLGWWFLKGTRAGWRCAESPPTHYHVFEAGGHGAGVRLGRSILTTPVLVPSP